jgi:CRISPR-associated protein Csm1
MNSENEISLAALLHDIGKFGQRAGIYTLKDIYKRKDYKHNHAAYTAQILNDLGFNLEDTLSDQAAMHHNPLDDDISWIIASADRMASGFEREKFEEYDAKASASYDRQRLWHIFNSKKRFKISTLSPNAIFQAEGEAKEDEYAPLWQNFEKEFGRANVRGNSSTDSFTIDYLLKKYTTFIPSSTSFSVNGYNAVKANISLYDHARATAVFAAAIYKLYSKGNKNIINYYKKEKCDIEQKDLLMICGDFFGIQNFIFDSVPAAKASKILRAKSAYVQILTKIIAFYIVEKLGLSYQSIITTNAGKFEILGVNDDESIEKLKTIQNEINEFFIENYFGQTGIGVSFTACSLADFIVESRYNNQDKNDKNSLRSRIERAVEAVKYQKFDLLRQVPVMKYDKDIDNQTLCPFCGKRKIKKDNGGEERCEICDKFIAIGEYLAKDEYLIVSRNDGKIHIFGDYYISFTKEPHVDSKNDIAIFDICNDEEFRGYAKWELASYVKKSAENEILTFEDLAENSCNADKKCGIKAIMALKGDVDNMGKFIKAEANGITNSFAQYNFFSRMIDYFFSVYTATLMKNKNLYTVFAGGDDIFILGAWDEVIEFAKELRKQFMEFTDNSNLSVSMGLVLTKPNKPVNFIADVAEQNLKNAKEKYKDDEGNHLKDAVAMFGECVRWNDYEEIVDEFKNELEAFDKKTKLVNTAFLYKLLEFADMSQKVKGDIKQTIWKSKLNYLFARNIFDRLSGKEQEEAANKLLNLINKSLDKYQEETKMALSEYIYKRREI